MFSSVTSHISYISSILEDRPFWIVGGVVRDIMMGRETKLDDIDITMAGDPTSIKQSILAHRQTASFSFFDTEKYGTMTIIPTDQSCQYEITPFRTETTYTDNRHPDEVIWSGSLLDDAARRDFTINCMYYMPVPLLCAGRVTKVFVTKKTPYIPRIRDAITQVMCIHDPEIISQICGEYTSMETIQKNLSDRRMTSGLATIYASVHLVLDPYHGSTDIVKRCIRCVGEPDKRFTEDALRLIRALRLAINITNCDIHKDTRKSLKKNAYRIRTIAKERIKQECDKVFMGPNPFGFVTLLDEVNMLKWIFPKLYDNKGVNQPLRYHPFDVYTHSMMVLFHLQALSNDKNLRYAALYHDVGKVEQYTSYFMGLEGDEMREVFGSWLNHPVCGAEFTQIDMEALSMSRKDTDEIVWYVRHHMALGESLQGAQRTVEKKLRNLLSDVGEARAKNLCLLTIADRLGQYNPMQDPNIQGIHDAMTVIDDLIACEGQFTPKDLAINGDSLMKHFKLLPGKHIGVLLDKAFVRVRDDIAQRNTTKTIYKFLKQLVV